MNTIPSSPPSSQPRAILFDLDGTVVKGDFTIDPRVCKRLVELESAGVAVGFATGRPLFGAAPILSKIPVDGPSMFFSGSLVCRPRSGEVLLETCMLADELRVIIEGARRAGLYIELYTRDGYFIETETPLTTMHAQYLGKRAEVEPFDSVLERCDGSILKIVVIGVRGETWESVEALARANSEIPCGLSFGAAHDDIIFANFTAKAASRARALTAIVDALRIDLSDVASFGDAAADLEFITRVGFGFAMSNAPADVRERSRYITDDVSGAGVLPALEWLFSGGRKVA